MKICVVSHPAESVQLKCQSREHGGAETNCTHFRHPPDEELGHVDIFLATTIICSLSTLNTYVHILLARPDGAFQSKCCNNNTPKAKNSKNGFH